MKKKAPVVNKYAKDLMTPKYKMRVVADKKKKEHKGSGRKCPHGVPYSGPQCNECDW